jgi:hypothetical protein
MWISFAPLDAITAGRHVVFGQHHLLAAPQQRWEDVKVGAGTPHSALGTAGWSSTMASQGVGYEAPGTCATRPRRCCSTLGSHGGFCIAATAAFSPRGAR